MSDNGYSVNLFIPRRAPDVLRLRLQEPDRLLRRMGLLEDSSLADLHHVVPAFCALLADRSVSPAAVSHRLVVASAISCGWHRG
jgi:hypothetical protein